MHPPSCHSCPSLPSPVSSTKSTSLGPLTSSFHLKASYNYDLGILLIHEIEYNFFLTYTFIHTRTTARSPPFPPHAAFASTPASTRTPAPAFAPPTLARSRHQSFSVRHKILNYHNLSVLLSLFRLRINHSDLCIGAECPIGWLTGPRKCTQCTQS